MAYETPTISDFVTRFPALDGSVGDEVLQLLLDEALRYVDNSWREADYKDAILYLVAHWLSSDDGTASASGQSSGDILSESFGPISVTYAQTTGANASELSSTSYGKRFAQLRRGNFPAILVV